jgi:hypothetical protein
MPMLPGEGIDEAEARLGEVPSAEWARLVYGSHLVEHLQEMLAKHLDLVTDALVELAGWTTDVEDYQRQLAEADPAAAIDNLSQQRVGETVAQLRQAVVDVEDLWAPIRDARQT